MSKRGKGRSEAEGLLW
uniref:Uncharacterized protein n=1 Tax=Rhizophora mucronata TaxID=61149 RepID=A0A2P2NUH3_RHIMU